jgi:hypothetical protein
MIIINAAAAQPQARATRTGPGRFFNARNMQSTKDDDLIANISNYSIKKIPFRIITQPSDCYFYYCLGGKFYNSQNGDLSPPVVVVVVGT